MRNSMGGTAEARPPSSAFFRSRPSCRLSSRHARSARPISSPAASSSNTSSTIPACSSSENSTSTSISSPPAPASSGGLVPGEVLNKVPVAIGMTPQLYGYLLEHTREHELLRQLRAETAAVNGAHMQITPEQGALLALLVELLGARRVVEVGVFTGYSSLAMAMALPVEGRLVALDRDERPVQLAQRFWKLAGVEERVELRLGPALVSLEQLLGRDGPGSYDMAFIDADKRSYDKYYEMLLQLVRPGGLIAIDNTLFYGRVVDPPAGDKAAVALRDLNAKLLNDPRVSVSLVPIGDGMTLCRRR